jgi:hypothetical protein
MYAVGIIEICVGILILTTYTRIGAYLMMAWLFIIVLNLLSMFAYYDICVRDSVMALGAYCLAQMDYVHQHLTTTESPKTMRFK